MDGIVKFERLRWGFTGSLRAGLDGKRELVFPIFLVYVLFRFLQCYARFGSYRMGGFNSSVSNRIAWGRDGVVVAARALSPGIKDCLRALTDHLGQFWSVERKRS
jgi:hypothetical protein